ncbi:MAG: PD-(D/E)XK nuclease family protein [Sulfurospirillum sp.]|nr:PD-(D/E)XK nuclease family protein [Sulfurospirillum sp.]
MTQIFPTSRCVREFYASFAHTDQLLPKALSIAEFEARSVFVPNKVLADEDTRVLLMHEAAKFKNFSQLKIEREFLSFLKNASYLFAFFEELAHEGVKIEALHIADTYANFEEHLLVLEQLLENYLQLLEKNQLYDKISLPCVYELNEDFLHQSDGFFIHLEGFLSHFEFTLLSQIARLTTLKIYLHVGVYNKKMRTLFSDFDLEEGYSYTLNLSTKEVESKQVFSQNITNADVRGFGSRFLQSAFVQEKINEFVTKGIDPERIAVILPDEKFASVLKNFDYYNNLNFAMGESFRHNPLSQKLHALDKFLRKNELEHFYRLQRLGITDEIVQRFKDVWRKKLTPQEIVVLLQVFCDDLPELKEFEIQLFRFEKFMCRIGEINFEQAMQLFLNRLDGVSVDDVRGGKVTVMGLLESRGVAFDGVIIVDFNDEFVPKRSKKDLFLSSHVRKIAHLPNREDRENLQRYFYAQLLSRAKEVAISFCVDEQSSGSRFLDALHLQAVEQFDEKSYMQALFRQKSLLPRFDREKIEGSYDLKKYPLSASKLKTVLTCKRQFYFKYIQKFKEAKIPSTHMNEADIGTFLHKTLFMLLQEQKPSDANELMIALRSKMMQYNSSLLWQFHTDIWMQYLKKFCENEVQRYAQGYEVFALEKEYKTHYKDFLLEGKIDRIDVLDTKLSIIDYKSGKLPTCSEKTLEKCVDFQLEFYYLLCKDIAEIEGVYYYPLKIGKLQAEDLFEQKLAQLDMILADLKEPLRDFEKCATKEPCKFCAYATICGRNGDV